QEGVLKTKPRERHRQVGRHTPSLSGKRGLYWRSPRQLPTSMGAPLFVLLCLLSGGPSAGVELRGTALAGGKPVADAVIWIDLPGAPRAPQGKVILDQRNLSFHPRVLAVQVGTRVDFPNHDRVFHNVFSFRDGKRFDLGLYP